MADYPPHYDVHAATMRGMVEAGMRTSEIAKAMGLSSTTVRRIKAVCLIEETADERRRHSHNPWADCCYDPHIDIRKAFAQIEPAEAARKPSREECAKVAHDLFVEDLRKYHPEREIKGRR